MSDLYKDKETIRSLTGKHSPINELTDRDIEELVYIIRNQGVAITIATIIEAALILWAIDL